MAATGFHTADELNALLPGTLPGLLGIVIDSHEPGRLTSHLDIRSDLREGGEGMGLIAGNHISPYMWVARNRPIVQIASPGNSVRDSVVTRERIESLDQQQECIGVRRILRLDERPARDRSRHDIARLDSGGARFANGRG